MVREQLKEKMTERLTFEGIFKQFGTKKGYKGYISQTILLIEVKEFETNKVMTDHLWFNFTLQFERLNLKVGDIVKFDGRVKTYRKGYAENIHYDYKISHPSKISITGHYEFTDKEDLQIQNTETADRIENHNTSLHEKRKNYILEKTAKKKAIPKKSLLDYYK